MGMGPLSLCRTSRDQNSKSSPVSFLNIAFLLKLPNVCFCYLHPHTLLHKIVVNPHLTDETLRLRVQDLILFNFLFVFFLNLIIYSFILAALGLHCRILSLVADSGDYSSLQCAGFSLQWRLLLGSTGSRGSGSAAVVPWPLQHVQSCQTRD